MDNFYHCPIHRSFQVCTDSIGSFFSRMASSFQRDDTSHTLLHLAMEVALPTVDTDVIF